MPIASQHCLSRDELLLSSSKVEQLIIGYAVPLLIIFGLVGNCINLTVLISMKSRSNMLLAALALCDTAFLIFMLPHCLAHYEFFAFSNVFRRLYFTSKIHLIAFLNWTSAAAIWLVLTICVERLIVIRYPLSNRKYGCTLNRVIICSIVCATFLLTLYNHISYECVIREFCHGTQLYSFCLPIDSDSWPANMTNTHSKIVRRFVRWNPSINALFVIFIPTVFICFSNVLLIKTMQKRQRFLNHSASGYGSPEKKVVKMTDCNIWRNNSSGRIIIKNNLNKSINNEKSSNNDLGLGRQQMRTEQKVTLTVCAIVTCFTITQSPSAIVALTTGFVNIKSPIYHVYLRTLTTFMVVLGKSLNFVLFCLSSTSFRQRLKLITKSRSTIEKNRNAKRTAILLRSDDIKGEATKIAQMH